MKYELKNKKLIQKKLEKNNCYSFSFMDDNFIKVLDILKLEDIYKGQKLFYWDNSSNKRIVSLI